MTPPFLVQRCTLKKGIEFKDTLRTGEYFDLDYMGSSEFEFGAIPQFQRNFAAKLERRDASGLPTMASIAVPVAPGKDVFALIDSKIGDEFTIYPMYLFQMYHKELHTKEPVYLREALNKANHYEKYCFWMDLTNDVIFTTQRDLIDRFIITVKNSVQYMDEMKAKQVT